MMNSRRSGAMTILALLGASCLLVQGGVACAGQVKRTAILIPTPPPGAQPYLATLARELGEALAAKGSEYEPRTHHLQPDGSPLYTNRLILQTSPYLIQHAHNPVDWYPWGDEAFERARELNRPVLLSIGYSTCHWCHVMEKESFEDLEIARYMNEQFIAIKVDREERPDVDGVYMKAVQMLTGSGGWPMTVVLTPDRKPFFGGTYFPARTGDRGSRIGFWELLHQFEKLYRTDREGAVAQAAAISRRVVQGLSTPPSGSIPGARAIVAAAAGLAGSFDPDHGGFGRGRKFPRPVTLLLLLRYHHRTGDPQALAMVERTLERMASGGIHDQVGGGFHRYTVERTWLVPHFEKMLYDNALLTVTYLEAYQVTGREEYAEVARRTLDYVAREMAAPGGGFHSATDADSPTPSGHQEEGWFFTWTPDEIRRVLGEKDAPIILRHFGVTDQGNFEGRNILRIAEPIERLAPILKTEASRLRERIDRARARMYDARLSRPAPHTDTKVITAWNGLMISAFARGARILGEDGYRARAEAAAAFLLEHGRRKERLIRSHAGGRPGPPGVLSDYAFFEAGLLDLFETTFEPRWLEEALALQGTLDAHFRDDSSGGYFMIPDDAESLLAREKPSYDGAEPAGNSVALLNLMRLYELTGEEQFRREAEKGFSAFSSTIERSPHSVPLMLTALDFHLDRPKQIVLVTRRSIEEAEPFLDVVADRFLPNRVIVTAVEGDGRLAGLTLLLENRTTIDGRATAYVCEGRVCDLPTTDREVFARQIGKVHAYEGITPAPLRPPRGAP